MAEAKQKPRFSLGDPHTGPTDEVGHDTGTTGHFSRQEVAMRTAVFVTYLLFTLLGGAGIVWFIPRHTPEYSGYGMPPGALPYTLCGVMILFSLPILVRTIRHKEKDTRPNPLPLKKWAHLGIFSVVLFSAMPLMQAIGFVPGAGLILAALQLLCGQRHLPRLLAVSVGASVGLWACMRYILHVPLP